VTEIVFFAFEESSKNEMTFFLSANKGKFFDAKRKPSLSNFLKNEEMPFQKLSIFHSTKKKT